MITNSKTVVDGYVSIHSIDVASLRVWWKALLLVLSNFLAIPAVIYGYALGFYIWASAILIAMIISIFYHLCQTTDFCLFGMTLNDWQITDHRSAGSILAISILLFFLYRPIPPKRIYDEYNPKTFGSPSELEYDDLLSNKDKNKVCFRCRGVNPHMVYDWQSTVILYFYIFVIILATTALPLTMQSFVIIIVFGVIMAFIKIVIIEEGNPDYLNHRFYFPALFFGLILIIISLAFYFIDSYYAYEYFHSLWHVFSNIGLLFVLIGTSWDVIGWFNIRMILSYGWIKTKKFFKSICCCCCGLCCFNTCYRKEGKKGPI